MSSDPFFRKIMDGLVGPLDPNVFEQCACSLLSKIYPGAYPLPGGDDAGMDGAVPDGEGEPCPIVCTTGEDVIGNLTRSLDSYLAKGGLRRKVLSITSQDLSNAQIRNLRERAREKGFQLVGPYHRQAVAEMLYRDSRWCRELLGLTGEPPALSKIPPNPRLENANVPLIGRDADLAWLNERPGDCILSGQPGTGKTHLSRRFVSERKAYFVSRFDLGALAGSLRDLQPEAILLDDAHAHGLGLDQLLQLRREGFAFRIVAVVWPSAVEAAALKLGISTKESRELDLLTKDQIVEVVKSAGVRGPDEVIREIRMQAEGKPGLAVILATLCLRGDMRKLWKGELLATWVVESLASATGHKPKEILAGLSLGGDAGLRMSVVAKHMGLSPVEVSRIVAELAAAGIVSDVSQDRLSVRPAALRHALVRDVFFCGARSLEIEPWIEEISDPSALAETLLGAAHRGAAIPEQLLLQKVEQADSTESWEMYA